MNANSNIFTNKKILIYGLGKTGIAPADNASTIEIPKNSCIEELTTTSALESKDTYSLLGK